MLSIKPVTQDLTFMLYGRRGSFLHWGGGGGGYFPKPQDTCIFLISISIDSSCYRYRSINLFHPMVGKILNQLHKCFDRWINDNINKILHRWLSHHVLCLERVKGS